MNDNLIEIKDLSVSYVTSEETYKAVNSLSLSIAQKETVGLVGETGAGKTTTALSILKLIPNPPGKIISGEILYEGKNVLDMTDDELHHLRGNAVSMIFQDPMTALNPIFRVVDQIAEVIETHQDCSHAQAIRKAGDMLEMVGIPAYRGMEYPHQFSGGMKQRVVIAIALACNPKLLIADEPTTALDVTIQAQVLEMMNDLKEKMGTSMLLITHDLGVVAESCDKVAIMYAGEIVEFGDLEQIFDFTKHPYTHGLFDSLPSLDKRVHRLKPIEGLMPDPAHLPEGCAFHPRCKFATEKCTVCHPELKNIGGGHLVRCHLETREE